MLPPSRRGSQLTLDGRTARTPGRNPLVLPTQDAALAVAAEWGAVSAVVDPRQMPLTRLVNSVIDGVARTEASVRADLVGYASSDLLVYRASEPPDLVALQRRAWDPIVAWSRDHLGAPMLIGDGVVFLPQAETTLSRLSEVVSELAGDGDAAPFRLGAMHVMTTLTGSALLAIAVAKRRLTDEEAWTASLVDEAFQISQWGRDAEAEVRNAGRWIDLRTAAHLYRLVGAADRHN